MVLRFSRGRVGSRLFKCNPFWIALFLCLCVWPSTTYLYISLRFGCVSAVPYLVRIVPLACVCFCCTLGVESMSLRVCDFFKVRMNFLLILFGSVYCCSSSYTARAFAGSYFVALRALSLGLNDFKVAIYLLQARLDKIYSHFKIFQFFQNWTLVRFMLLMSAMLLTLLMLFSQPLKTTISYSCIIQR